MKFVKTERLKEIKSETVPAAARISGLTNEEVHSMAHELLKLRDLVKALARERYLRSAINNGLDAYLEDRNASE